MKVDEARLVSALQEWFGQVKKLEELEEDLRQEGFAIFAKRIRTQNRVVIPPETMERLEMREGDWVLVLVAKVGKEVAEP